MKAKKAKRTKRTIALVLCFTLLIALGVPVHAWKLNTHVYSGNLVLEDLKDGYLDIDGLGRYKVPEDIYSAVSKYPESYRAGTLGPDVYPEMATGQGNIHPGSDMYNAGDYLELLIHKYHKLPKSHPEKEKIYAFILGYATHYAGDLFGHTFINEWSEGVFPGIEEIKNEPDKAKIALRHIASEGYVDGKVPEYQKTGDNIKIDAPIKFIKEVLIDDAAEQFDVSVYLETICEFRDELKEQSKELKAYKDQDIMSIINYPTSTNYAGYIERWQEDIDKALIEWVEANHKMAENMLDKDKSAHDAYESIGEWTDKNGSSIVGVPDFIIAAGDFVGDIMEQLTPEIMDTLKEYKKDAVLWTAEEVIGIDINEMLDALKNPELLLNSELFATGEKTSKLIDEQIKNFGKTDNPADIEFEPFYNTVQMSKLILLGYGNLNQIFPNSDFESQKMMESFNKIDIKIKTGKNRRRWWESPWIDKNTRGTDDDLFFVLSLIDGSVYEKLMDKPGYDDFESNDEDTYTLELPKYITYKDIKSVGVRKYAIIDDDWYPYWITVTANKGKIIAESGYKKTDKSFNRVFRDNYHWTKNVDLSNTVADYSSFDPEIISFIESLDDSRQWEYSKMYIEDREVLMDIIFKGLKN